MRITKFYNNIINVLNNIQKGWSFIDIEWTAKKIVTWSLDIFIAVTNWIKGVVEIMLKFMFSEVT